MASQPRFVDDGLEPEEAEEEAEHHDDEEARWGVWGVYMEHL